MSSSDRKAAKRRGGTHALQTHFRVMRVESLEGRRLLTSSSTVAIDANKNLVITGSNTGSNFTIAYSTSPTAAYTITDNNLINTSIAGATGAGTYSVTIPESAIKGTNVSVSLIGLDDSLTLNLAATPFPQSFACTGSSSGTEVFLVNLLPAANLPASGITFTGNSKATSLQFTGDRQDIGYTATSATTGAISDGTGTLSVTNVPSIGLGGLRDANFVTSTGVVAPLDVTSGNFSYTTVFTSGINVSETNSNVPAIFVQPAGALVGSVAFFSDTNVDIDNSADLGLGVTVAAANNLLANNTTFSVNTAGALSITGAVSTAANGNISLTSTGVQTIGAAVTANGSGTVTLDASGGNLLVQALVSSTSGAINATAGGAITESGSGAFSTTGLLTAVSSAGQTLNGANKVSSFNAANTVSGDIDLTNAALLTISLIGETGGNVQVVNAGGILISGSIGGGNVSLQDSTSYITELSLGSIACSLLTTRSASGTSLDDSNAVSVLNSISQFNATDTGGDITLRVDGSKPLSITGITETGGGQGDVTIRNDTGAIDITGPISETVAAGSVFLLSDDQEIQEIGNNGSIGAPVLTTESSRGTLLNGGNTVKSLNAYNAASGDIDFTNTASPLTITGISQKSGGNVSVNDTGTLTTTGLVSTAANGNISLTSSGVQTIGAAVSAGGSGVVTLDSTGGNLLVNAAVSSTSGPINTTAGGTITEAGSGIITAAQLSIVGGGSITLTNNNQIGTLLSVQRGGAFHLTDAQATPQAG